MVEFEWRIRRALEGHLKQLLNNQTEFVRDGSGFYEVACVRGYRANSVIEPLCRRPQRSGVVSIAARSNALEHERVTPSRTCTLETFPEMSFEVAC
jgi:hypothetical protein